MCWPLVGRVYYGACVCGALWCVFYGVLGVCSGVCLRRAVGLGVWCGVCLRRGSAGMTLRRPAGCAAVTATSNYSVETYPARHDTRQHQEVTQRRRVKLLRHKHLVAAHTHTHAHPPTQRTPTQSTPTHPHTPTHPRIHTRKHAHTHTPQTHTVWRTQRASYVSYRAGASRCCRVLPGACVRVCVRACVCVGVV